MAFPTLTVGLSQKNPGTLVDIALIKSMYEAGYNLVVKASESPASGYKKFWFGTAGMTKSSEIDASARKMRAYMNGGMSKMHFICTALEGSMMSYQQYAKLKVSGGPPPDQLNKANNVMVNAGFLLSRYSYGEKVGAILHEITHMCIGTIDVEIGGKEYYGADYCVELAEGNPDLAATNADNWCYYLTAYHKDIIQKDKDWSGLTPYEVGERRRAALPTTSP